MASWNSMDPPREWPEYDMDGSPFTPPEPKPGECEYQTGSSGYEFCLKRGALYGVEWEPNDKTMGPQGMCMCLCEEHAKEMAKDNSVVKYDEQIGHCIACGKEEWLIQEGVCKPCMDYYCSRMAGVPYQD